MAKTTQIIALFFCCLHIACAPEELRLGAERTEVYLPLLEGQKIGVVSNQSSLIGSTHLVDSLLSLEVEVVKVFSPEHGFRGTADAGAMVADGLDVQTGLPIVSLYGSNKKPSPEQLEGIEVLLFDIQDVGARFYTYISTLHYVLEAAAENGIKVMVLDRPNPNGHYVDGPILDTAFQSFVGMHPIPIVHGMTIGEYAQMINGEGWLPGGRKCELMVIPCKGYAHSDRWFPTIAPSPNLPSDASIALYPSLCLFEPTAASIGRGTPHPFECVGFPGMPDGFFGFTPEPIAGAAPHPKHEGVACAGHNLTGLAEEWIQGNHGYDLSWIADYSKYWDESHPGEPFIQTASSFGRLAGTDSLLRAFQSGKFTSDYPPSWLEDLQTFHKRRLPYLLYPLQRDAAQK